MNLTPRFWLCKRKAKSKSGRTAVYWTLRWTEPEINPETGKLQGHAHSFGKVSKAEAHRLRDRFILEYKEAKAKEQGARIDSARSMTLERFRVLYREKRARGDAPRHQRWSKRYPKVSDGTLAKHDMTIRYLIAHFGASAPLAKIAQENHQAMADWLDRVAKGQLRSARKWHQSQEERTGSKPVSEQTMLGLIRDAKTVFGWALVAELTGRNPMDGFSGTPLESGKKPEISLAIFERVYEACPSDGWRGFLALCRLAGLRLSTARLLPWDGRARDKRGREHSVGVDWKRRRLSVVAVKTGLYREVPISERLFEILSGIRERNPFSTGPADGVSENNIARLFERIVRSANLAPWSDPFQSLRSSCENGWKAQGIAEATYCAWIGHSPKVSRMFYTAPTEAEFERITGQGSDAPLRASA